MGAALNASPVPVRRPQSSMCDESMKLGLTIWLWFCMFMLAALAIPLVMGVPAPLNWPWFMKIIYGAVFMSAFARLTKLW